MQQAARVADRTAFLYLGNLIEEGPTSMMFNNPKDLPFDVKRMAYGGFKVLVEVV